MFSTYSRRSSNASNDNNDLSPFSQKKCLAFFSDYTCKFFNLLLWIILSQVTLLFFLLSNPLSAPDEPDVIGPEGIERFCKDIEEDPEDIVMLVLAWKMDAKQMGYFTLKEWLKGLSEIQ